MRKHFSPQVCRPNDLSPPPINFSFGTLGRMVKPVKRFQHRGMIPVLGPRRRRAPRNASIQEVPGSIPGSAPNAPIFFAPGGYTPPKTALCDREPRGPPMHPRSHEHRLMRLRWLQFAQGSTRDPRCSFADETAATTSARYHLEKYKTPKFSPQSPQSPHLQSRRPPHNLR